MPHAALSARQWVVACVRSLERIRGTAIRAGPAKLNCRVPRCKRTTVPAHSILVIAMTLTLAGGCATVAPRFQHEGHDHRLDRFYMSRYACYNEARSKAYNAAVDPDRPVERSAITPRCDEFSACLAALGYVESASGDLYVLQSSVYPCIPSPRDI